ncbi:MAG: hypothetical protein HRT69_13355 [Flavobacteriaceae bacterium]|nr:hypothetical protein [Flavobacteriaceae bacterium]
MKIKINHIIIIILGLIIFYLTTCTNKPQPTRVITKKEIRIDSVRVVDTIETILRVPIASVPIVDTIYLDGLLNAYIYSKNDSLLYYKIRVDATKEPSNVSIEYNLKNFTILDSTYIRDSVYVKEQIKKSFMSFGGSIIANKNTFGLAPALFYNHKSGNSFGLGYNIFGGEVMLTYVKKISFRKK